MMRRLLALASAALMTVVGLSLTTASAASLGITTPPETFLMQESACAPAMHNASPVIAAAPGGTATGTSYSRVSLSDIPASCQNLPLDVFVHGSQGALVASATVPGGAQSSTVTVNVGNYAGPGVTGVVLRIDGWLFLTTWTPPAPTNPVPPVGPVTCYQLDAHGNLVTDASGQGVQCLASPILNTVHTWPGTLQVEYTISAPRSVLLVFDFSHARYAAYDGDPASSSVTLNGYNGSNRLREGYDCGALPVLEVVAVHPRPHEGANNLSGAVYLNRTPQWGAACAN